MFYMDNDIQAYCKYRHRVTYLVSNSNLCIEAELYHPGTHICCIYPMVIEPNKRDASLYILDISELPY